MAKIRAYASNHPRRIEKRKQDARGNALLGAGIGLFAFYLPGELILTAQPHPWHWLLAAAGAIIGYLVAYVWLMRQIDE